MAKILLHERVPQAWFDSFAQCLREAQPEGLELELVEPEDDTPEALLRLVPEADVLVVGLTGQRRPVERHVLEDAVKLKLLQKLGSRESGVDIVAAIDAGVPVSLLPVPAHIACAEHTLMLILAAARKLLQAHQAVVDRRPKKGEAEPGTSYAYNWPGLEGIGLLAGKVLGLIGMGDIAVEVAYRAEAFGMEVIYTQDEPIPEDEAEELGVTYATLEDLLRDADVVSLHAALTPRTEKLIGAPQLALMKPTAILVNTARGGLVDEAALADALGSGALAAAAIDAWATEPVPRTNPLLKLPNVVATPHVAAGTLPPSALYEAIVPNILAALTGEPVFGLLTPPPIAQEEPQPAEETGEQTLDDHYHI